MSYRDLKDRFAFFQCENNSHVRAPLRDLFLKPFNWSDGVQNPQTLVSAKIYWNVYLKLKWLKQSKYMKSN